MTELGILLEPHHGAHYEQILALARAAEDSGLDAFFRSDHYLGVDRGDRSYRSTDSWMTLAGLARETSHLRLGTLVTAGTFRLPGPLAVAVATANAMSGGRIELGIGTGWYEDEHLQYGIPFPPLSERFDRLEEVLEIVTGLWGTAPGESYSFAGEHFAIEDNVVFAGKWPRPPIIVGGMGPRRTPTLAARYADEFNAAFSDPAGAAERFARVRRLAEEGGRDPSALRLSVVVPRVCVGADAPDVARRETLLGPVAGGIPDHGVSGSPEHVADRLAEWIDAGVDRIYVHQLEVDDVEHVRLLGERVAPLLRQASGSPVATRTRG
jgi:F420-dependent oxidoreductase-like protein